MADPVTYSLADCVATITMDDGKANALSVPMLTALHAAFEQAEADAAVVVLAGREGRFSGGFDLATLQGGGGQGVTMLRLGFELAGRMLAFPKPVVIACTGHAVAMGSFLLVSADYRVGTTGPFKITANEVLIGLTVPWAAIELCRQRLSPQYLHRALALAEVFTPETAVEAGFLDQIVAPGETLDAALQVAGAYTAFDDKAHAATKARLREDALPRLRSAIDDEFGG